LMSAAPPPTDPSSIPIPPNISEITGPLLFGPIVNWALYGVLCVQIYVYSYNFPQDKPIVKFIAYFVFVVETVQTALSGADVYYWFVQGFGNMERLTEAHFAPIDIPIIHAIVAPVVKGYFCYRIWTLNKRLLKLCIVIALNTLVSLVGAAWGGIAVLKTGKFSSVSGASLYVWSISSALADILITTAMMLLLIRARCDGGRFSNFVMLRLVRLTIETNALTTVVAIATIIFYAAIPHHIYFVFTTGICGKLYTNTLLVSLNNRIYFRDHPSPGVHIMSDHGVGSDQSRRHFNPVGSTTHVATQDDNYVLKTISHTIDLEKGKSDGVSISSDPSHSK